MYSFLVKNIGLFSFLQPALIFKTLFLFGPIQNRESLAIHNFQKLLQIYEILKLLTKTASDCEIGDLAAQMSLYLLVLVTQFIGPLTLHPPARAKTLFVCSFQPIHANAHLTDLEFEKVFSAEPDALRPRGASEGLHFLLKLGTELTS